MACMDNANRAISVSYERLACVSCFCERYAIVDECSTMSFMGNENGFCYYYEITIFIYAWNTIQLLQAFDFEMMH